MLRLFTEEALDFLARRRGVNDKRLVEIARWAPLAVATMQGARNILRQIQGPNGLPAFPLLVADLEAVLGGIEEPADIATEPTPPKEPTP